MKEGCHLKAFHLIQGGRKDKEGREPPVSREERTYDEQMDEVMAWNVERTDIVAILQDEIDEERLSRWSEALEKGVRKNLDPKCSAWEENPWVPTYRDLFQFVRGLRTRLLGNPSLKHMKPMERSDALTVCILCGIRALQKKRGTKRPIDTIQWMMLERYLG